MLTSRRPVQQAQPADAPRPTSLVGWAVFAGVAVAVLLFFATLYPLRNWYFPVGPDAPVYLWWTRLASHDGLSAVWVRPGVPSLALVLTGTLHLSLLQVLAGIGAAGAVCVGLASAALVDLGSAPDRWRSVRWFRAGAAGLLAGTFAAHLADGYFANLLQAALFLGAVAAIASGSRVGLVAAAGLLTASALTHPQFFLLGCGILVITALLTLLRRERGTRLLDVEGGRILAAIGGAALAAGGLFAALAIGPGVARVDTSQDAFLRRGGLRGLLHREYRGRFVRHLNRYVLPAQIPLAVAGFTQTESLLRRFLETWGIVLVAGVAGSLLTGLVPAVRFFAFGYVLPILAGLGLVALAVWLGRRSRVLAAVVAVGLIVAIALGAMFTWLRTKPFISRTELSRAAVAGRVASTTPSGTPIVVVVDTGQRNVSFLATRVNNVLRDAVPRDRIRDVFVYVGSPKRYLEGRPTLNGEVPHDAMSRLYLRDIQRAGGHPLAFVLALFNRSFFDQARSEGDLVSPGVILLRPHPSVDAPRQTGPPPDVPPSSGWPLALSCIAVLAFLGLVGFGWSASFVRGPAALGLAPVVGAGGLILATVLFERFGLPLTGAGPPIVSAVVAGGGYLAMLYGRRRGVRQQAAALAEPPGEIP